MTLKEIIQKAEAHGMSVTQLRGRESDDGFINNPKYELFAPDGMQFEDECTSWLSETVKELERDLRTALDGGIVELSEENRRALDL